MLNSDSYRAILDGIPDGVYVLDPQRKIVYWNAAAQRISGFSGPEIVGKSCCDNLLTHVDGQGRCLCTSQCPAAAAMQDGQPREALIYLHHKDGYRVPVYVTAAPVRDASGVITHIVEIFREDSARLGARAVVQSLKKLVPSDLASGLPNRRIIDAAIQSRLEDMRRFGWPFGLFIAELDHFQQIRTEQGSAFGDRVVKMVAGSLANAARSADTVGRWSDQQFLAVIANASTDEVQTVAERARMLVETSYLNTPQGEYRATVSIGASAAERGDSATSLLRRAEVCLYHSRSSGRNRVTVHQPTT